MSNFSQIGKVLWWCARNENGIITDSDGKEFYFDRSVLSLAKRQKIERGSLVMFEPSKVDQTYTARSVTIPQARYRKKYEQKYEQNKNQLTLPFELGSSCQAS